MASGLGKRFGGNKLLSEFLGKPMIQWILDVTNDLFDRRVVVTRHKEVQNLCWEQGIDVILHTYPGRNDTIRLGLEALGEEMDFCMFCPADQPLICKESLEKLMEYAAERETKICRLTYENAVGAPVIFPAWTYPELMNLPEGKGGGVLLKKYVEQIVGVPAKSAEELLDFDTKEAVRDWTEQIQNRAD